jgi:DNA-binding MarR family transcriptional regulator
MAAGLANDGRTPAQIAGALCIDESTVTRLLAVAGRVAESR